MAYIGSSPTKVVSRQSANIFTYTATANQTAFTGADANGNTLACSPSDLMVHMNGIKLEESDYTATTTTVTLGSGAAVGDEVTITAFLTFESADHYTKSAADTRYVNASGDTMSGDLSIQSGGISSLSLTGSTRSDIFLIDSAAPTDQKRQTIRSDGGNLVFGTENDAVNSFTSKMTIDSSGRVLKPYQPAIEASGANITPASATWTKFDLNNNVLSRGGMSLDTTNDRITVPSTGYYLVNYWIMVDMSTNSSSVRALGVRLYKNGSIFNSRNYWSGHRFTTGGSTTHDSATGHFLVNCSANDYLEFHMIGYDSTTGIVFAPHITVTFQG